MFVSVIFNLFRYRIHTHLTRIIYADQTVSEYTTFFWHFTPFSRMKMKLITLPTAEQLFTHHSILFQVITLIYEHKMLRVGWPKEIVAKEKKFNFHFTIEKRNCLELPRITLNDNQYKCASIFKLKRYSKWNISLLEQNLFENGDFLWHWEQQNSWEWLRKPI